MRRTVALALMIGGCSGAVGATPDAGTVADARPADAEPIDANVADADGVDAIAPDSAIEESDAARDVDAAAPCDVSPNRGCTGTMACYFVPRASGGTAVATCLPAGTVAIGGPCSELNDCAPGAACDGGGTCIQYCTSESAGDCPSMSCMGSANLPAGNGYCQP